MVMVNATIRIRAISQETLSQIVEILSDEANRVSYEFASTQEIPGKKAEPIHWVNGRIGRPVRTNGKMKK